MRTFVLFISLLTLAGCINHTKQNPSEIAEVFEKSNVVIEYAKCFSVDDSNPDYTKIKINSGDSKYHFTDSIFILNRDVKLDANVKVLNHAITSLVVQSTTHLAYFKALKKLDFVKGVCGVNYINNSELIEQLKKNHTEEISLDGKIETEKLLKTNPELFFIYPFELDNADKYNEMGVKTLLITEYLEEEPLARVEWIKLFGLLLDDYDTANLLFNQVKSEYNELCNKSTKLNKTVMFNLPYKDNWNMPSANSFICRLTNDAGFDYYYKDEMNTDNLVKPKEVVWSDGQNVEYWIIIADRPQNFSLNDLIQENEAYGSFKSVQSNQVIFCNTAVSDYFVNGVMEPEKMLKDLMFATGQINHHTPKYFKILK